MEPLKSATSGNDATKKNLPDGLASAGHDSDRPSPSSSSPAASTTALVWLDLAWKNSDVANQALNSSKPTVSVDAGRGAPLSVSSMPAVSTPDARAPSLISAMAFRAPSSSTSSSPDICLSTWTTSDASRRPSPLRSNMSQQRRVSARTWASQVEYHLTKASRVISPLPLPSMSSTAFAIASGESCSSQQPSLRKKASSSSRSILPLASASMPSKVSLASPTMRVTAAMPAISKTVLRSVNIVKTPARKRPASALDRALTWDARRGLAPVAGSSTSRDASGSTASSSASAISARHSASDLPMTRFMKA
mmetsp:Transcript_31472/g.106664  ORF Transcript_31472/g.106664 Transcript_31472/m.106664 type:complete len:308 (-) Transcript_31472:780-1703(-)